MDMQTERAVLSGISQYGFDAYVDTNGILDVSCFNDDFNQKLYKCYEEIFSNGSAKLDVPTIQAAANKLGYVGFLSNADDKKYVRSLFNFPIELENIRTFAGKLRKLRIANDLGIVTNKISYDLGKVTGDEKLHEIVNIAENPIFEFSRSLGQRDEDPVLLGRRAIDIVNELISNPIDQLGISTGYKYLDHLMGGGMRPGGFNMIVARPKTGKSTLVLEIADHTSSVVDVPTLIIDTEMSEEEQVHRALANIANVKLDIVESGYYDDSTRELMLKSAERFAENKKLFYKNVFGCSFAEIIAIIRRWIYRSVGLNDDGTAKPCVVIYDYFKLTGDEAKNQSLDEHKLIGYQAQALHDFCGKYRISCLAFVQSNRDGINNEHDGIVSQSDRLAWSCISLIIFKRKSEEEINEDGQQNGNRKMVQIYARFGEEWDKNNYISYKLDGAYARLIELEPKQKLKKEFNETVTEEEF